MSAPEKYVFSGALQNHIEQRGVAVAVSVKRWAFILLALAFCLRFQSCADDSEIFSDAGFVNASASFADGLLLSWAAPRQYTDSTALDPLEELDVYEIHINRTGVFFPDDEPSAYVSAIDSRGIATEEFDLSLLGYPFEVGQTYHVSMRSVSKSGSRSDYSRVFTFTIHSDSGPGIDQFLCTPSMILRVRPPKV